MSTDVIRLESQTTNYKDKSLYFYLQNYIIEYILIHYHCIVGLMLLCHWNVIRPLMLYNWSQTPYKVMI